MMSVLLFKMLCILMVSIVPVGVTWAWWHIGEPPPAPIALAFLLLFGVSVVVATAIWNTLP